MFSIFWLSCTTVKSTLKLSGANSSLMVETMSPAGPPGCSPLLLPQSRGQCEPQHSQAHKNTSSSWEQLMYWSPLHNKARHTHSSATRGLGFDRDWNRKWTGSAFSSSSSDEHLLLWDASVTIIHTEPGVFSCAPLFPCYGHMGNESMYPYISLKNQKSRTWIQSTTVR